MKNIIYLDFKKLCQKKERKKQKEIERKEERKKEIESKNN
jgi:hypothetical protein